MRALVLVAAALAATVLHYQGKVVGAWVTVGHNIGEREIYAVTERDAALASRGRR